MKVRELSQMMSIREGTVHSIFHNSGCNKVVVQWFALLRTDEWKNCFTTFMRYQQDNILLHQTVVGNKS